MTSRAGEGFRGWLRARRADLAIVVGVIGRVATSGGPALGPLGALVADAFQRAAPRPHDPAALVRTVAIDGESLARYGQPAEIHAEILAQTLDGVFLQRPD